MSGYIRPKDRHREFAGERILSLLSYFGKNAEIGIGALNASNRNNSRARNSGIEGWDKVCFVQRQLQRRIRFPASSERHSFSRHPKQPALFLYTNPNGHPYQGVRHFTVEWYVHPLSRLSSSQLVGAA